MISTIWGPYVLSIISKSALDLFFANSGELVNVEFPTMGGEVFWKTEKFGDYKLQINSLRPSYARILDKEDNRLARGDTEIMREKIKRLSGPNFLLPGDIIGVTRKKYASIYDHYAVYIGGDEVIHYAAREGDFNGVIHRAPFSEFLKEDTEFFLLMFRNRPESNIQFNPFGYLKSEDIRIYSPENTIERAKSRLGEDEYSLLMNNCEHFAIWCKTGVSESSQVKQVINLISQIKIPIIVNYDRINLTI